MSFVLLFISIMPLMPPVEHATDGRILRIHLNAGHRWNKLEDTGYGMGQSGFQPWPPRYQSAAAAGGPGE